MKRNKNLNRAIKYSDNGGDQDLKKAYKYAKKFLSEEYMSDNEFNRFAVIAGIGLAVLKFI